MPNTTVDTLEVKIVANALAATESLKSLSDALKKVRGQLTGADKSGVTKAQHLAKSLNEMNGALNTLNTSGVKKLQKLANAVNSYADACQRLKGISSVGKYIKDTQNALDAANNDSDGTKSDTNTSQGGAATITQKLSLMERLRIETQKAMEKFQAFNKKLAESNGFLKNFWSSIKRIAFYRAIRSALKAIGEAFETGLKNAYGFSQQSESFKRLADTLDRIKSVTAQMTNQLGAFWGEVKQFVLPVIEWLVEKVRQISESLTELFAALNGEATYLQAQYVATAWNDATDALKKYKGQLLGLDELNNLTANKGSKEETDYSKLYKEVAVSKEMSKFASGFLSIKKGIEDAFSGIWEVLVAPLGMAAVGAILLFTGNALLGLGLLVAGVTWGVAEIIINWDEMREDVAKAFQKYDGLFAAASVGLIALGAILLFVPGHALLGLSLLLSGGVLGTATVAFNWTKIKDKVSKGFKKYKSLFTALAVGTMALGAILLFVPGFQALGLTLLLGSGALGAATVAFNWTETKTDVENAFKQYEGLFGALAVGATAVGAILLFVPGQQLLGLTLLLAGGALGTATVTFNWDSILDSLKGAWQKIKNWWNSSVKGPIHEASNWIEETFHWDLNGDGQIGGLRTDYYSTIEESSSGKTHGGTSYKFGSESNWPKVTTNGYAGLSSGLSVITLDDETMKKLSQPKALGGIADRGTLFYAGESGAEFVGNIGSTSAVANTGQMTEAIYKAAYMGMSKALKENGGSGMSGFEPATTDDLFIAMRKKANNYNKMTGNSAFA